jgi:hypothetical protein
MNEGPKPQPEPKPVEDQELVNDKSMDGQKDDSEDLKKDTIDQSHALKWVLKIRIDGKTKTVYWEAISKDGVRKYIVEPHSPFLAMITHKT